jgi:hypothetical protein
MKGFPMTTSMPSDSLGLIWEVLCRNVPADNWRAAMKDDYVACCSVKITKEEKFTVDIALSNAFVATPVTHGSVEPVADSEVRKSMVSM